ncbi:MAG: hypothetical protein KAT00_00410 [Planctomycetes bacterium]|nr:hypothetical protein [Planctomycetota bacterium]
MSDNIGGDGLKSSSTPYNAMISILAQPHLSQPPPTNMIGSVGGGVE